jgi:hypothetical protein
VLLFAAVAAPVLPVDVAPEAVAVAAPLVPPVPEPLTAPDEPDCSVIDTAPLPPPPRVEPDPPTRPVTSPVEPDRPVTVAPPASPLVALTVGVEDAEPLPPEVAEPKVLVVESPLPAPACEPACEPASPELPPDPEPPDMPVPVARPPAPVPPVPEL